MLSNQALTLTPWSLIAAIGALTAFQVGLYTLVARERKSPYLINSVFLLFLLDLFAAALALSSAFSEEAWKILILKASAIILLGSLIATFCVVFRMTIRFVYFIDDPSPKHWPVVRQIRQWFKLRRPEPNYSHDPVPISDEFRAKIIAVLNDAGRELDVRHELALRSLAVATEHQAQANKLLGALAVAFLSEGHSVQYLTASRHPVEFIKFLHESLERSGVPPKKALRNVVVIDAYTPHFGFVDSIYTRRTKEVKAFDVIYLASLRTFAGMHTATSRAFNAIQKRSGKEQRGATLVVYEDCFALADLESVEQYRIFVRHVIPSERMWDAMFTVFVDSVLPENEWRLLQSYASLKLDLRDGAAADEPSTAARRRVQA